jgi:hypothetical protein
MTIDSSAESIRIGDADAGALASSSAAATATAVEEGAESDGEYDEDDADLNRTVDELQRASMDAHASYGSTSLLSSLKWTPDPIMQSPQQAARYASRCIASLPRNSPWQNKTVVVHGLKCVVRSSTLEVVPTALMF